jgi:16S rRNA (uracil1498-N3)-methyltransferase
VARKAVDQCRRRSVPVVSPIVGFENSLDSFSEIGALKLILYEKEHSTRLKDVVALGQRTEAVVLACGPEGGFTGDEVSFAHEKGFVPVSLGGRILRCETAALAALVIVQHAWGDL